MPPGLCGGNLTLGCGAFACVWLLSRARVLVLGERRGRRLAMVGNARCSFSAWIRWMFLLALVVTRLVGCPNTVVADDDAGGTELSFVSLSAATVEASVTVAL